MLILKFCESCASTASTWLFICFASRLLLRTLCIYQLSVQVLLVHNAAAGISTNHGFISTLLGEGCLTNLGMIQGILEGA